VIICAAAILACSTQLRYHDYCRCHRQAESLRRVMAQWLLPVRLPCPGQLPLLYLPTWICPRLRHLPCYSFRSGTAVDTPDKINIVPPSVNAKCWTVAAGPHSDEQRAKHVRETRDEIGYSAALAIAKLRTVAAWAPSLEQHAQHERGSR
jgi:hypothetical protein